MRTITHLWFDTQALEAAEHYCSIFPGSRVGDITHYPKGSDREGQVLTVDFELAGTPYMALNGGPEFTFDEAISIVVECDDQAEIDRYWDALVADGGEEGPCGWCKDKYGLSWQVFPSSWKEIMGSGDPDRYARGFEAMMQMRKIDMAAIEAAADGA